MNKLRYVVLMLLAVTLVLGAQVSAQDETTLRIVVNGDVRTADPHVAYEFDTWPTVALFHRGLVTLDDDGNPEPALAESWEASEDGTQYTFTLVEGAMFSDGSELTAEDVAYSFTRLLDPETASPTAFMFEMINGAAEFQAGEADSVSGIEVIDDRTISFTLTRPEWTLMKRFALPPAMIVQQEAVEASENYGREPMGAGPYMLESWESGLRITGVANPNYYLEGAPFFDRFEIEIGVNPEVAVLRMEAGEADTSLDFVPNSEFPRIAGDPELEDNLLRLAAFPNIDYVIFNTNIEPFSDPNVRKALDMAVDRDRLIQLMNNRATPANGPVPPNVAGSDPDGESTPYDPEMAMQMLADAGYADGFSTEMLVTTDPQQLSVAQAVVSDWAAVGVEVELISLEVGQFVDLLINQPDEVETVMTQWFLDYLDPSNVYEPLLQCGGSYNWGRHCNEDLDAQFAEVNLIPPGEERDAAFAEIEAALNEQVPNLFLYHLDTYYFTSDRIDIKSDPAILLEFDTATLAEGE